MSFLRLPIAQLCSKFLKLNFSWYLIHTLTFTTFSSCTRPIKLHEPRHSKAWVDVAKRQLWVWDKMRWPWLNNCSTLTDVPVQMCITISCRSVMKTKHTWNRQIIKGHVVEVRIYLSFLIPPLHGIQDILRQWWEVEFQFVNKRWGGRGLEHEEVVKHVSCMSRLWKYLGGVENQVREWEIVIEETNTYPCLWANILNLITIWRHL